MEEIMPEKFPEVLPPKGEGRVDSKHRVALLTEPEIEALNFLKNMDKAMGYKSGFSPMMQNLAAQNTQPLEYVEYRGERIPSLNDFSEGGYGGGGDRGSSAGEQEARNQTSSGGDHGSSNSYTARMKRERDARLKREKEAYEKRQADLKDIEDYIAKMDAMNADYHDLEDGSLRPEREPGYRPPEYGEPGYQEPTRYPDYDGEGLTREEFESMAEEYEIYPEYEAYDGSMHYSQASADAVNERLTTEARSTKESELTDYGSTEAQGIYDEIASDFQTHLDSLSGQRQTAYNQALAGLYDDQQLTGVWDQDAYDTALSGLDETVLTETGELEDYGASLKTGAEDAYNTWLTEQMSGLGEQDYQGLQDWSWEDLDLSDFTDDQEYKDFDFLSEFKKLTPEGEAFGAEGETGIEGAEGDAAPASRTATKKKKKYTPTTSSASLTGSGSSANIS